MQCRTVLCDVGPLTRCLTRRLVAYLPSRRCEFRGDDLIVGSCAWGCRMTLPGPSPWQTAPWPAPTWNSPPSSERLNVRLKASLSSSTATRSSPRPIRTGRRSRSRRSLCWTARAISGCSRNLAVARLHLAGFADFAAMLASIRQLLTAAWQEVHPQLDPDDEQRPDAARQRAAPAGASELRAPPYP